MKTFLRDILTTLILAAVIFFGIQVTIQRSIVISSSMEPTLSVGQHLMINKVIYKFHQPERGDIVVFHSPDNQQDDFIKRIIGLPGERVEIDEGMVYIHKEDSNLLTLDEPYITDPARYPFKGSKIPENEYFALGDNRNNSGDSREGWTVPRSKIVGKAWLSIWPPEQWGVVSNNLVQSQVVSTTSK